MLLDPLTSISNIQITEFPGKVVVRLHFRWTDSWGPDVHGQEGVWYKPDDYTKEFTKLKPFEVEDALLGSCLVELKPVPFAPPHQMRRHRFLVRWWDADVYLPTIKAQVVTLIETHSESESPHWTIAFDNGSLEGITLDL